MVFSQDKSWIRALRDLPVYGYKFTNPQTPWSSDSCKWVFLPSAMCKRQETTALIRQDRNYIKILRGSIPQIRLIRFLLQSMHITVPGTGLGGKLLHPRSRCVTEISRQPWHRILNFSARTMKYLPPERSSPEYDSGILIHVPSLLLVYTETSSQSFHHTESSI